MQNFCDAIYITLNKNTVIGDKSALTPGGVRIGSPAFTSRGATDADFVQIGEFLHEAVQIALEIQSTSGKMLKDFILALNGNERVLNLRDRVIAFATRLPMPGFDTSDLKYKNLD
jgi:glycine hydroxymethyltransferase